MRVKRCFRFRALLIGLLSVKIGGTLFYLAGPASVSEILFHQQVAIAQEKEGEKTEAQAADKTPKPETVKKKSESADVGAVLKRLEVERKRIGNEEERIKKQRAQLEALKTEIEEKIERLSKIQQQIVADLDKKEALRSEKEQREKAAESDKIKMLSKVYASMKPKQAAAIIDKMDIEIIQKVFSNMKGEQVGSILSYVERERAAKISERLAENVKPSPGGDGTK